MWRTDCARMRKVWRSGSASLRSTPSRRITSWAWQPSRIAGATCSRATGKIAEAKKAYSAALAILQKLADWHPTVTLYQSDLATSQSNLGNLLHATGAPAEARTAYEAALAIRQKLADAQPTISGYQSNLALILNNLGALLSEAGAPAEARKTHESGPGDPADAGRRAPDRYRVPEQPGDQPRQPRPPAARHRCICRGPHGIRGGAGDPP